MRINLTNVVCGLLLLIVSVSQPTLQFVTRTRPLFDLSEREPQCPSQIYCYGDLLKTIQMAKIYPDSKTFVDMKLKSSPSETLTKFNEMMENHGSNPNEITIKEFVNNNFLEPGEEFENWDPVDWTESPKAFDAIVDPQLKTWAHDLNAIWKILGRKMTDDVANNPESYSIIHVPNPVIVPGGRFREFYYWDSYWIVRGLLYSEMATTVRGMLSNFLSIIDKYGFIPNGGRVYYAKRSQPPLLAAMIQSYVEFTKDEQFAIDAVELLDHEFQFWMNNHTCEVKNHVLALYGDKSTGPRPESYREDVTTSIAFETEEAKEEHYAELKAAAESGMDFSSRWFIDANGSNKGTLKDIKTRAIIPVELNAILFWNAKIIAEFYRKANKEDKAREFDKKAQEIFEAIDAVLWNEDVGAWLDYDLINNKPRNYFTPTNLSPLWMRCYDTTKTEKIATKVLEYIKDVGIDAYPGGVPNTLEYTGEQWDFPNVWPPMQYILIEGLENLGTPETKKLAFKWASRWTLSNFKAYSETHHMYEKYDAETFGGYGGGGEYDIQLGFGWSNGVILEFLVKYGDKIRVNEATTPGPETTSVATTTTGGSGSRNLLGDAVTVAICILAAIMGRFVW